MNIDRYARHLALPEITPGRYKKLRNNKILFVGAGGLGAPALPYLAAAGIGHITIADHDQIDITNLHRQTIYKTQDKGQSKAQIAAAYLQDLNPDCNIKTVDKKITAEMCEGYDLIVDGTDNFKTKTLLNDAHIKTKTPLISASVNRFKGQSGIFAGFTSDKPCYHCLFPQLPTNAKNCNEAGVLGTAAGLTGLYQAHLALCFLLSIDGFTPGTFLSLDFKTLRTQKLTVHKNQTCKHCEHNTKEWKDDDMEKPIEFIPRKNLKEGTIIIDVRTGEEVQQNPIEGATHIELTQIPERYNELPQDKPLAFACSGNVRSHQAAAFLQAMGYNDVCVMDVLNG